MSVALEAARSAEPIAVEGREVAHRYGRRVGLEPVSFTFAAPGTAAVTGANGAGKSTLLRILAGLLRATSGATVVTVGSRAIEPAARRDWIGFASPELSFYEELSVEENLKFAAEARGQSATDAATTAMRALTRVGLEARARDRVSALSSGMKQRLRLAFGVLHAPRVLLLDEPGSHLDDAGRATVTRLVQEQAARDLVIIATNDEREWRLAGQRIELRGGGLGRPA